MDVVKEAVEKSLESKPFSIKPQQFEAISNIIKEEDTLCIFPTSFGKSLIFQLLPSVYKYIGDHNNNKYKSSSSVSPPPNPVVIILSPLLSLISDQVKSANSSGLGLHAAKLDVQLFEAISSGKFNLVFGTPECWLSKRWKDMLGSSFFKKNLVCIVVDEVHKVTWVSSTTSEKPFREAFGQISILRSVCKENIPILALSATINVDLTKLVIESCNLCKDLKIISVVNNRTNIRLSVVPIKKKNFESLRWIVNELLEHKENTPKVIIYCRSVSLVGWVYFEFLKNLKQSMSEYEAKAIIGMYHSMTLQENKNSVLQSLTSDGHSIRVVIATSSLGCGINMKDVVFVVHFGPAYDIVDYCQQIGRAGRGVDNNTPCHAILYSFSEGSVNISKQMKQYIKSHDEACLRVMLYSPFNNDRNKIEPIIPLHSCCSSCALKCDCEEVCVQKFSSELVLVEEAVCALPTVPFRKVTEDMESLVKKLLLTFRDTCFHTPIFSSVEIVSGLCESTIEEIIQHLPYINSLEYINENLTIINDSVAQEVLVIIQECFEDFEFQRSLENMCIVSEEEKFVFSSDSEVTASDNSDDEL